jgi:AhpD family alkylhydroperoxidase
MDTRTQVLIGIGAAVTSNCTSCLKFYVTKARETGASEEDIQAALNIGWAVRDGAASHWDKEAEALVSVNSPA